MNDYHSYLNHIMEELLDGTIDHAQAAFLEKACLEIFSNQRYTEYDAFVSEKFLQLRKGDITKEQFKIFVKKAQRYFHIPNYQGKLS